MQPQVWTSRGTLSDKKASIWANAPPKKGLLDSTRDEFVSLGHIIAPELDNPSNVTRQGGGIFNRGKKPEEYYVSLLELMPPPLSYRMVSGTQSWAE